MHPLVRIATAVAVGLASTTAFAQAAYASPASHTETIHVHEASIGAQPIDLAPTGASYGDELVGANTLSSGKTVVGADSFVCTTVSADGKSLQCAAIYQLKQGRITALGYATIKGTNPLFDEQFAITGGTGAYQGARGQVRVVQTSEQAAELYLHLLK